MQANPSIRALYKILGFIIGRQIHSRIRHDQHLEKDHAQRKVLADETIAAITKLRKALAGTRNFNEIANILSQELKSFQLAWILEAFFLLNQSSTTSAEIVSEASTETNREFARELIGVLDEAGLDEAEVRELLEEHFSANLVLTAHPTAGIQPDYMNHINNMVAILETIPDRSEVQKFFDTNSALAEEIKASLDLSISHMVRAKPYNEAALSPVDESKNFLINISKAASIIPAKLAALELELKNRYKSDFRLNNDFFKIHSWVARDIDGNPTVSSEIHLDSLMQERETFLVAYREDVRKLCKSLSDDFSTYDGVPTKTFFSSEEFKNEYEELIAQYPDIINKHQAYRVVLEYKVIKPIDKAIEELLYEGKLPDFDIESQLLRPLELIRANKEGVNTQEIDTLIKKIRIFGGFGSKGHTRQGADILAELMYLFTGFPRNSVSELALADSAQDKAANPNSAKEPMTQISSDPKTDFILKDSSIKDYVSAAREELRAAGLSSSPDARSSSKKLQRVSQTLDLLALVRHGGIERQIISMNESFADMLNVLVIAKALGLFIPSRSGNLPQSKLEIVPLTERITDLRSSYQCTMDALMNSAWREYLIAQGGRFIKMRGPSDSGKQNGFIAAQWEMFKSKTQDSLVIEIFNAFLAAYVFGDDSKLQAITKIKDQSKIAELAFSKFTGLFDQTRFSEQEKLLWQKSAVRQISLVNFDGWGEPIERGGGLEFRDTVRFTQPLASSPVYERTLQGGGAQQFGSAPRTRRAIKEYLQGLLDLSVRSLKSKSNLSKYYRSLVLDPDFVRTMDSWSYALRKSLRNEVFGIDTELDEVCVSESNLRAYFRHVIKSPLVYLDHFNIASRPTSRSGSKVKELVEDYDYDLDKLASALPVEDILSMLGDIRAIPYAAMFSLVGGNHVSFYGFASLDDDTLARLAEYYALKDSSQEHLLIKHMIDSLEKGIFTMDMNCYAMAHTIVERASNAAYNPEQDPLIKQLIAEEQKVRNFIAKVKRYPASKTNYQLEDLLIDDPETRDLLIARRNDAAVPRIGIAVAMANIIKSAAQQKQNPLEIKNISYLQLDLLRKAFASGASTFGNGCID